MNRECLLTLAEVYGIDSEYQTVWGHAHVASDAALRTLLESVAGGTIPESAYSDPQFLQAWLGERKQQRIYPHPILAEAADAPLATLDLRSVSDVSQATIRVEWEQGGSATYTLGIEGSNFAPSSELQKDCRPGYHKIHIELAGKSDTYHWILSPAGALVPEPTSRFIGLSCFLPSLRSERNWGCGDFQDLATFAGNFHQLGFSYIALNPLHALANRIPYNASPYSPLSLFTLNWLYLAMEQLPEYKASPLAQALQAMPATQAELQRLRDAEFVQYEGVSRIKLFFGIILYREFLRNPDPAFAAWKGQRAPWLSQFCTYLAFWRYFHKRNKNAWVWRDWPSEYQDPSSEASRTLATKLARQIDFHAWLQWRLEQQKGWAASQVKAAGFTLGLYCDLPVACDQAGPDRWGNPELFAQKVRVGSPPDGFNPGGQDWGFPMLRPLPHCPENFEYFRASLQAVARSAGIIRLDHVMRLARLYCIPDGMPATEGAYVRDQFEAMLRIIAIESHRAGVFVVGEDLGTVPSYFREALERFGILSYRLTMFEWNDQGLKPAEEYPSLALCSFTTHDLATFDGYLSAQDILTRKAVGWLDEQSLEEALNQRRRDIAALLSGFEKHRINGGQSDSPTEVFAALASFLKTTPCRLVLFSLEEFLGEVHQMNLPGSTAEYPNWQRKTRIALEDWAADELLGQRMQAFQRAWQ
ncbi:MAG: 4-alpha-glucanotransferase [Bryobacter sp.]|nr:4-alpha-glucanotransferase [Bryobacter sp.]